MFLPTAQQAEPTQEKVLRVGASGTLTPEKPGSAKESAALSTLQSFIKNETGLDNVIVRCKSWQQLLERMVSGQCPLGVFQGYEFAWAQEKNAGLKPLALAINVYRYPKASVVVREDNTAANFADLRGQSFFIPAMGTAYLRLFIERQCQPFNKKPETFFSQLTSSEKIEDALDDVVDGPIKGLVADQATLEAFKRRKPARYNRLKPIVHSQPFPPAVIAFYNDFLERATMERLLDGLLNASQKEKGQTLLTLFRLTDFETPPSNFNQILMETRKAYPPPNNNSK
jgi:ABC-type phosphate/phosphonate transport system substrate-binding protein